MELIVKYDNDTKDELISFINYIIPLIRNKGISLIADYNFSRWDAYINNLNIFNNQKNIILSTEDILIESFSNLKARFTDKLIYINVDDTIFIPNTTAKFIDICKLINYGNIEINSYPIFDKVFKYFSDNILDYYYRYKRGV